MKPSILSINKQAGDANIGQTLVRLARLADVAHMGAVRMQSAHAADGASERRTAPNTTANIATSPVVPGVRP
jgi:hypothetical protein